MNVLVITLIIAIAILVLFRKNRLIVNACLAVMGLAFVVKGITISGASMWKSIAFGMAVCGILLICIAIFREIRYFFKNNKRIEKHHD